MPFHPESCFMSSPSAAASSAINVLIADSNRMQAQLLTSALRRRSEFRIFTCPVDVTLILQAVASNPAKVVVLSLNHSVSIANQMAALRRVHLSHPAIAKILLVESYDRTLVVSAFRSGVRGIFCIWDTHFRLLRKCILCVADGQIWANTEQTTFLLDLISQVPSLRVLNSRGQQLLTPRPETHPQRAHRQEVPVPHLRQAGHFVPRRTRPLRLQPR